MLDSIRWPRAWAFITVNIAASSNSAALLSNVWQSETSIKLTLTLCDVGFSILNLATHENFDAGEERLGEVTLVSILNLDCSNL